MKLLSTLILFEVVLSYDALFESLESSCTSASCSKSSSYSSPPFVTAKTLVNGTVSEILIDNKESSSHNEMAVVHGCCSLSDELPVIGHIPQFTENEVQSVIDSSKEAWNGGTGEWPQMSIKERMEAMKKVFESLSSKRDAIVKTLMWEIGKNEKDAFSEFDRSVSFFKEILRVLEDENSKNSKWNKIDKTTNAFVRRAAIGIILCLGPFNYPLNETYAALIPALLMGNVVIVKIPTMGGLVHMLTMEAFTILPAGTINFISGSGRTTIPKLMSSGYIDGLAFIGGSNAADKVIRSHPLPHRLKLFLQLEAKNMAIFLPDLFEPENEKALDKAIDQTLLGSLSYNGQRCTALKLIFVPKEFSSIFNEKFVSKVESLRIGLPWQKNSESFFDAQITPLPNKSRINYMKQLIDDATKKGASILNKDGGSVIGGEASSLMIPAVLFPVKSDMNLYEEEQFGPVIPITEYSNIQEIINYAKESKYAQQCSLFTQNNQMASNLIDIFSNIFGKINLNAQCGRSPDTLPFSGRRSSALGIMSVDDVIREFSIPTVISFKTNEKDEEETVKAETLAKSIQNDSIFMS